MATGSITDAAKLLHVSIPAVSRTLSHTESQLDFPLFIRIRGRLTPTAEARQLYHEVEDVYQGVQRIGELTQELMARRSNFVSVVSSPGIGHMLLPLAIARFHQSNPETHVHFNSLNQGLLRERLLGRHFDFGIALQGVDHPNVNSSPIARSRILCICPRNHALAEAKSVSATDLAEHEVMTYPRGTPFGDLVRRFFAPLEHGPRMRLEVGSPQHACAIAQFGSGVALVDEFTLQAWPHRNFATLEVDDVEPLVAHLVHLRTDPLPPPALEFVSTLRRVLSELGLAASPGQHA